MQANSRLLTALLLAVALACGALWGIENARLLLAHASHDAGWDLYAANAVLHGVQLDGPRLIEVNPPFLVWFFMLPVLLARLLHLSLTTGFAVFVILGSTLFIVWFACLYSKLRNASLLNTWLVVLGTMYVVTRPISLEDRGEREYFVALLLLPYILWAVARLRHQVLPVAETIAIAIAAVLAICLKPQHALDVVALELFVLLRFRSVRRWFVPQLLIVALGPILYVVAVWCFAPQYIHDVVPLLKETYWGLNQPWHVVLEGVEKPFCAFAVAVILYATLRRRLRTEVFLSCLLALSFGALCAYLQQHKGWSYQTLVLQILSYLAVCVCCVDIGERLLIERGRMAELLAPGRVLRAGSVGVALLAFSIAVVYGIRRLHDTGYPQVQKEELAEIYSHYPAGTPVGFLGIDPWEWPEVLEQDKTWASRYMHLWMLPAIIRSQDPLDPDKSDHLSPPQIAQLSAELRQTTAQDLQRWQPPVVVSDPCGEVFNICASLSRSGYSSMLTWFQLDPGFRAQWAHYRLQKQVGDLQVYTRAF